ncbi:MAG: carboxypeptidase M32 [Acholeplasmataceae bacterium]|nr:carboxypeptidase M32 [Acholeplasmataceae bacterium]
MENYINIYKETRKKLKAYSYMMWLMSWDRETEAPKASLDFSSQQFEVIYADMYQMESDPKFVEAIEKLYENLNELEDKDFQVEIKNAYKELRMIKKVPKEEYLAYGLLTQKGSHIWAEAREKNDFELFRPTLEKIVEFNQKLVKYLETEELKGYDVLLDMYEEAFGVKEYDLFFNKVKEDLAPFVLEVTSKKERFSRKLTKGLFPVEGQKAFGKYLMEVFSYDQTKGVLKESAHPFTSGMSSVDTRITTHYHEDNLLSSIFSIIHEMGHAIYELQNDPKYDDTMLHGGTSLGIHESESRMYENMIGRSYAFWSVHYPKLVEIFPKQLKNVTLEEFYKFMNKAERSLIRIEADELTYSLHVLVRYELEKQLISGKLKVKDLPKRWNSLMSKYVGKRPKLDSQGVLQDIHWSGGAFGYFPTYALGSAYAAQIYQAMNKEINVEEIILNNDIKSINAWLKEHVHQFGKSKTPKEILQIATKEDFNPSYYIEYLKRKFS